MHSSVCWRILRRLGQPSWLSTRRMKGRESSICVTILSPCPRSRTVFFIPSKRLRNSLNQSRGVKETNLAGLSCSETRRREYTEEHFEKAKWRLKAVKARLADEKKREKAQLTNLRM